MTFPDETDEIQDDDGRKHRLLSSLKAARGVLLTLLSAISVGFAAEFMALANKAGIPGFQLNFLMRLCEFLTLLPVLAFSRPRLTGENTLQRCLLLIFAIIGNVGTVLAFLSFTYAVPGIAFAIVQGATPFFVACVGFIFLKESLVLVNCCGILINVTGVVLVAVGIGIIQIGTVSTQLLVLSIVLPLLAALTFAPDMVVARYLTGTQGVPVATSLLYLDLLGALTLLCITYAAETPVWTMSSRTILYVIGLGLSKSLASFTVIHALKVEKAYITTAVRMFVIPVTILLDYIFLQKVPNALQWGGVVLIVLGTAVVCTYTWWSYRQEAQQKKFLEKLQFGSDHK